METEIEKFDYKIVEVKNLFQDANINFLLGSGVSSPYFGTLGNIEIWLSKLEEYTKFDESLKTYVKASLYASYYKIAMKDNFELYKAKNISEVIFHKPKDSSEKLTNTYSAYKDFLRLLNQVIYNRRSNTVNKMVNLFTTNVDIFLEKVIEDLDLHCNDGFNGIFVRRFSLSNFRKACYQKSSHYDNITEIPVYNLLKIHGSVTWRLIDSQLQFKGMSLIKMINESLDEYELLDILKLNDDSWKKHKRNLTIGEIIDEAKKIKVLPDTTEFITDYEKLQVVNPTKEKFKDTTFNKSYYEMLRMYANELEKESSILYIMGFSMADEHIRDITFRAIKSNPTLKVFICSYLQSAKDIIENLKQDNIDLKDYHNVELINPFDNFSLAEFNENILKPLLTSIKLK